MDAAIRRISRRICGDEPAGVSTREGSSAVGLAGPGGNCEAYVRALGQGPLECCSPGGVRDKSRALWHRAVKQRVYGRAEQWARADRPALGRVQPEPFSGQRARLQASVRGVCVKDA